MFKICSKCNKKKPLSDFHKDDGGKFGVRSDCKECSFKQHKKWIKEHKDEVDLYHINYRKKNKDIINKRNRDLKIKYPWYYSYNRAKQRCNNPNCKDYPWYGLKGIQFLLTKEDCAYIWDRDKANLMKIPSIDRIDSNKNYELSNCQFIEKSINSKKDKFKPVLQYDLQGNFIKEWQSATEVNRVLNIDRNSISACARGEYAHAGYFLWQYK